MRNGTTALALALTALTSAAAADMSVAVGKVFQRPSVPKSLSGITYAGGNRFWTVADDGTGAEGGLYACTIDLGPEGTNVVSFSICSTNERVRLGTASDLEGCAFDPATGRATPPRLIATRATYGGEIVPKEPHLADCAFTSGLVRRPDGLWDLYSGLCDSAEGRVTLLFDPFAP